MNLKWLVHFDLHETTDSDFFEFTPAKAARDGELEFKNDAIPDGFYTIGYALDPKPEFYKSIIDSVRKETHIAPPDENGEIIGLKQVQDGVVYDSSEAKIYCDTLTGAEYVTTTEVYPDSKSKNVTNEECNRAQLAAVVGGLDFILSQKWDGNFVRNTDMQACGVKWIKLFLKSKSMVLKQ